MKILECVSISVFFSSVGIPIDIASYAVELKTCVIIAGIKIFKSIIKKKRKKHDKIVLLAHHRCRQTNHCVPNRIIYGGISRQEVFFVFVLMRNFSFPHFLSSNFDFICNNNKQVYFVKMHPTMSSEYAFCW